MYYVSSFFLPRFSLGFKHVLWTFLHSAYVFLWRALEFHHQTEERKDELATNKIEKVGSEMIDSTVETVALNLWLIYQT